MTAYQIAFLERVPAFAAVNDAVTLAPPTPGVSAFVNAVLRVVRPARRARAGAGAAARSDRRAGDALLVPHVDRRALGRALRRAPTPKR